MNLSTFLASTKYFGLRKLYYTLLHAFEFVEDALIETGLIKPSLNQSLLKRHISRILIHRFSGDEGHNIDAQQKFIGFGLMHYAWIRNLKPTNILCVGSRVGFIPAILALACKDNGTGSVDFVDAGYDEQQPTKHWSGIGFWGKNDPKRHFGSIGVSSYITTYVMTTEQYAKKYTNKRYQYIYIDGDHSYVGVSADYRLFWPKLDKNGLMIFHDVVARGYLDDGKFGVWKLWKKISKKNAVIIPFPKESGLGIIQKR